MDLTVDTGYVPRGDYGSIVVMSRATLAPGISFRRLELLGALRCGVCEGGDMEMKAGVIDCSDSMRVGTIHGHGVLRVEGDLLCSGLDVTGMVRVAGRVECTGDVRVQGVLESPESVRGRDVHISGTVRARRLQGLETVDVRPLEGILLSRPAMVGYRGGSRAAEVTGTTVRLTSMRCGNVEGEDVTLAAGSHVHTARFTDSLSRDALSSVLVIDGDRRRVRLLGS